MAASSIRRSLVRVGDLAQPGELPTPTLPQRDPMKNPDGPRPGAPAQYEGTIGVEFKF
jgi:hypothetical protein